MPAKTKPDEVSMTLQILDQQMIGLINPANAAIEVEEALDHLHAHGANPEALDAIAQSTTDLYDMADRLRRTCQTALATARTLKAALDELRRGIETCNTDIPEIDQLREVIENDLYESAWWNDMFYEDSIETIAEGSGLTWDESQLLWDLITRGQLAGDSSVWDVLREWLEQAELEARRS